MICHFPQLKPSKQSKEPCDSCPSRPLTAFSPTQYTEMNSSVVYNTNISVHVHALLFVIRAALLYLRRPNNQIFISVFAATRIHRLNNIFLFIHLEECTQAQRSRLVQTNEVIKGAGNGKGEAYWPAQLLVSYAPLWPRS